MKILIAIEVDDLPAVIRAVEHRDHRAEEITPEWCMEAFKRVNPGADLRNMPSLYVLDFAREVLRAFP